MSTVPSATPEERSQKERERKAATVMMVVFFIIGLSVILSYQWGSPTPAFREDAGMVILFGILVAAIIYIAARYAGQDDWQSRFRLRFCPNCGRQIRFDATVCPYCNHRLP